MYRSLVRRHALIVPPEHSPGRTRLPGARNALPAPTREMMDRKAASCVHQGNSPSQAANRAVGSVGWESSPFTTAVRTVRAAPTPATPLQRGRATVESVYKDSTRLCPLKEMTTAFANRAISFKVARAASVPTEPSAWREPLRATFSYYRATIGTRTDQRR